MAFALLHEPNSEGKRAVTMKRDMAEKFLGYMKHPETIPDDFWREKTAKIKTIWVGRAPVLTKDAHGNYPDTNASLEAPVSLGQQEMYHPGRLQGRSQQIPNGDQ